MLKAHMDAVENTLLATSKIPANSGHVLHKGTPRESFIRQFLETHLSERVAIGSGEIIDCHSQPNPPQTMQRNQFDIVVYSRDFPRLDIGGGISAFLAESVVATIEVKSEIDATGLKAAINAAKTAKSLKRNNMTTLFTGHLPPSVLNYVVAFEGPVNMNTIYGWIQPLHTELNIPTRILSTVNEERYSTPSPSLDGIFVLGKGFIVFDNKPLGFINSEMRNKMPNACWNVVDTMSGNLLFLFSQITLAVSGVLSASLNLSPYLSTFKVQESQFLP